MISLCNTSAYPWAMMIVNFYASIASVAMKRPRRSKNLTSGAISKKNNPRVELIFNCSCHPYNFCLIVYQLKLICIVEFLSSLRSSLILGIPVNDVYKECLDKILQYFFFGSTLSDFIPGITPGSVILHLTSIYILER